MAAGREGLRTAERPRPPHLTPSRLRSYLDGFCWHLRFQRKLEPQWGPSPLFLLQLRPPIASSNLPSLASQALQVSRPRTLLQPLPCSVLPPQVTNLLLFPDTLVDSRLWTFALPFPGLENNLFLLQPCSPFYFWPGWHGSVVEH